MKNQIWDGVSAILLIAAIGLFLVYVVPVIGSKDAGKDCYIEWDGRANSTECD